MQFVLVVRFYREVVLQDCADTLDTVTERPAGAALFDTMADQVDDLLPQLCVYMRTNVRTWATTTWAIAGYVQTYVRTHVCVYR